MFAARGQRDIENARRNLCIVKEQLEKIAHAVEQQAPFCLLFQLKELGHHWGGLFRHSNRRSAHLADSESRQRVAIPCRLSLTCNLLRLARSIAVH